MDEKFNRIIQGDCIALMNELAPNSVDLAFADPPFNIGYEYDVYHDAVDYQDYLDWSRKWISSVFHVLKPDGTFWLAIGDEYAAELKIESQKIGFHCRSWVVWYYTFGVNCSKKFTRSHAHLFHFVKDPNHFTFREEDLDNRVPSARELVYNDKRANPKGRLPDDTWIIRPSDSVGEMTPDEPDSDVFPADNDRTFTLRPQDLEHGFRPSENTWYFPRVAGTFKERAGFHGCQMPEQLLGRIIRICSNPGDVVLDPFSGSATTVAVAKKLGRRYLGYDISQDYVQYGVQRLNSICVGDRLDGSPEPLKSAPRTNAKRKGKSTKSYAETSSAEKRYEEVQIELTELGVAEAFSRTHDGFSADRVVADPALNAEFVNECSKLDLVGDARHWNMLLFRLRKAGRLNHIPTTRRTYYSWEECDNFRFASEIAWQSLLNEGIAYSLDEILCDPRLSADFDNRAKQFAPGFQSLDYRWAALALRKEAKSARTRAAVLEHAPEFSQSQPLRKLTKKSVPQTPGIYVFRKEQDSNRALYAGETLDLRMRLSLDERQIKAWETYGDSIIAEVLPMDCLAGRLTWQSFFVRRLKPHLNCFELQAVS